jgi:hypothetical protein
MNQSTLRFCAKTKKVEVYEVFYVVRWRVQGFTDDWLLDLAGWTDSKSERTKYATSEEAQLDADDMQRHVFRGNVKVVKVLRRVT